MTISNSKLFIKDKTRPSNSLEMVEDRDATEVWECVQEIVASFLSGRHDGRRELLLISSNDQRMEVLANPAGLSMWEVLGCSLGDQLLAGALYRIPFPVADHHRCFADHYRTSGCIMLLVRFLGCGI